MSKAIQKCALRFCYCLCILFTGSCKKLIGVPIPVTSLSSSNVYTSDESAAAVLNGIYINMSKGSFTGGVSGISVQAGASSDELTIHSAGRKELVALYQNNLTNQLSVGGWRDMYNLLLHVNSALEGISQSNGLSSALKKQLEGEAKFLRAFYYFYLVNLYGDVPLTTTSDWKYNANITRSGKDIVWKQIIKDLTDAEQLLSDKYLQQDALTAYIPGTEERVRPTSWAASALLARAYLYTKDWANAEIKATHVISNTSLFDTVSISNVTSNVFEKNSKEAIWQLMSVNTGINTWDGNVFILTKPPSAQAPIQLSSFLNNSFELNDKRKSSWISSLTSGGITYYFPFKYKVRQNTAVTEYLMVLRLAEQYLIRAEARTQQNKFAEALADLNVIRKRAGLADAVTAEKNALLTAILLERQVELFTEWGHRWLDLKRSGNIDAVMTIVNPQKANGVAWQSYKQWYPLLLSDILLNPNLTQNSGY